MRGARGDEEESVSSFCAPFRFVLFDGKTKSQKRSVSSGHAGLPPFGAEERGA